MPGPFKITEGPTPDGLTIEKWRPDALDSPNSPKKIKILLTDENAFQLALDGKTNGLDHNPLEVSEIEELKKRGWSQTSTEVTGETFIILNPKQISLQLRKYLYSKVNQDELSHLFKDASYSPAYGLIPKEMQGQLLKSDISKISVSDSFEPEGQITVDFVADSPMEVKISTYLKSAWETPQFKVHFNGITKGQRLNKLFKKESQAILGRKGVDYPDGYSVLGYFLSGIASNYFFVEDSEIDRMLLQAPRILNEVERIEHYKKLQVKILKQYTVIPLLFGSQASGMWGPNVKSVPAHPLGYHTLPLESVEMN